MAQRIVLFGLLGGANIGNNATCQAMLAAIRSRLPSATVAIVAPADANVRSLFGTGHIPMDPLPVSRLLWRIGNPTLAAVAWNCLRILTEPARRARAYRLIRDTDLFIVPGTGIIDEFGQTPLAMPLDLDRWTHAARRAGARIHFLSIGVEALASPLARVLFRRSLRRARTISVRDQFSLEQLGAHRLRLAADLVPDLAFGLDLPVRQPAARPESTAAAPRIVLGIMGYYGWNQPRERGELIYRQYLERIAALAGGLLDAGYAVTLVIGDTRADQRPLRELTAALRDHPARQQLSVNATASADELLQSIATADLILASRYHNVLFGVLTGRRTISLSYARKNDELIRGLESVAAHFFIEDFAVPEVLGQVRRLLAVDAPVVSATVTPVLAGWRRQLDSQYDGVLAGPADPPGLASRRSD